MPLALLTAVVAISFAAPFFRKAEGVHPLLKAAIRLAIAAVLLSPFVLRALRSGRLKAPELRAAVVGGGCYALHFGAWVTSLGLTTVAASVTLVTATPLLLAVVALVTGRDRPSRGLWVALVVALIGVTTIGGADLGSSPVALAGDGLALLGAGAMAGYMLTVRPLGQIDVLGFMGVAVAIGALILLAVSLAMGLDPTQISAEALFWLAMAALVPQLIGHSALTWSLRHTSPTVVGMATVGEPVGAAALAWIWLGEQPSGQVLLGCLFTMSAVMLALRERSGAEA